MILRSITLVALTAWMTLCDRYFHVATGTVVHFWRPLMGDQTVWVIPMFAFAAFSFMMVAPHYAAPRPRPVRFVLELVVVTAIYAASGLFGIDHPHLVTVAFVGLFALRVAASDDRGSVLGLALILALAGPLFESIQWQLGMFRYTQPDVIGVPWWLFAFYANAVWATREFGALLD